MARNSRDRDKYRNTPYGAGTVTQRGDGWQARWTEAGKRKGRMFATQQDAEAFLLKRWQEKRAGTYREPSQLTVSELVSAWLERNRDTWSPNTYQLNRHVLRAHVAPYVGDLKAATLDPARVQHMVDTMRADGKSANLVRSSVRVVSSAYRSAIRLRIVSDNPATGLTLPRYKAKTKRTWTAADIERIDAALQDDPRWLAAYRLCLSTGMRPGELLALRWSDIDLDLRRVTIRRTLTKNENGETVIGHQTKTGRDRIVTVAPSAILALRAWRTAQLAQRLAAPSWHDQDLIVCNGRGEMINPATWYRIHVRLCERAGVERITLHGLRHTFATIALERGIHPRVVQEMLGHASITMTLDLYSHVSSDLQAAASDAIDAHLFGGPKSSRVESG